MVKKIYLPRGFIAFVSVEDFEYAKSLKWSVNLDVKGRAYACRYAGRARVYMHREFTNCTSGLVVDHINGNTLDNRRTNLRICTQRLNIQNSQPWGLLGLRGVSREKQAKKYRARITDLEGDELHLGMFDTQSEAAEAYDRAALSLYGNFAWLNTKLDIAETEDEPEDNTIPF